MRRLILLRHAKSDWSQPELDDFDRPLNKRGKKAIALMGRLLESQNLQPDWVVCSSAKRTRQTLAKLRNFIAIRDELINYNPEAYLADLPSLIRLLSNVPGDSNQVLLVGHNPGLEELLEYLCGSNLPQGANGKCMPTATCAAIALPDDWSHLEPLSGTLEYIKRPKEVQRSKAEVNKDDNPLRD